MTIQDAYTAWSATYDQDRNLTRDLDARVTRSILSTHFDHNKPETIIELGCGTGKNTLFFSELGRHTYALDFSEGMIRQARAKVQAQNVTFARADLTQPWTVIPAASANLATCNLVLEHISDLSFIFAQATRILVPGGYFFISELHPFRQYLGKKAEFARAQETVQIPAFVHHISEFTEAGLTQGYKLISLQEWWHEEDRNSKSGDKPPRLVTFLFQKSSE